MHYIIGGLGLLGLIAMAFGEAVAVRVAQFLLCAVILVVLLIACDILVHGALSRSVFG